MVDLISPGGIANGSGGRLLATDPQVVALAKAVSGAIRRYCRWHIAPQLTETLTVDAFGGRVLNLPTMHVVGVQSVIVSGVDRTSSIEWSQMGTLRGSFPDRFRSVEVTLTHGYELEDVADLVGVGEQIARNAAASPMGIVQEALAGRSVTLAQLAPGVAGGISLLERDRLILDQYRRPL